MAGYWTQTLAIRISRRRALAASGAAAASAAFLAACGGGDKADSGPKDTSGLLTKAENSSSHARQGGTWPHYVTTEVAAMDPLNNASAGSAINNQAWAYSRFLQWKPGVFENPVGGDFVLDAAESWEQSPDGLRLTFKVRQDLKFDPRPPTNGRLLNTQDIKWSWDRYSAGALTRADYVNALNPEAPVESMQVADNRTIVFRLAFPTANMASRFAFHRCLSFLPVEAEDKFDPRTDQRGSGPWMLRKWEPSVGYTYDRNPNWPVRKGEPFLDTITLRLVTDPAQRRAQLVAGNLWTILPANIVAEDVLAVKREQPKLNMYANQYPWGAQNHLSFGWVPGNPWGDVRVRRAVSLVLDRDIWIDTFYNVGNFEKQGLPMDARWNTHYFADDKRYWLDPKPTNSKLGEGAQYFKHDPAEATKLMRAAGFSQPIRLPAIVVTPATNQVTALHGMLKESGLFDLPITTLPVPEHDVKIYNSRGVFEGLSMAMNHGVRGDIDQYLSTRFSPGGASGTQSMFPEVFPWYRKAQDLITAQRRELDDKKRLGILEELQKELAIQMPTVPYPGAANGFSVAWPQLANFGVFSSQADPESTIYTHLWNDDSKKPA
jgi:peptide/nickel transport system substrate-binding protein